MFGGRPSAFDGVDSVMGMCDTFDTWLSDFPDRGCR